MKKFIFMAVLLASALFLPTRAVVAQEPSPQKKGLQIVTEADRRDEGFQDYRVSMTMTLKNRQGKESVRELRVMALEVPGDGDKSLSIFDSPMDVKGTAFLSFTHKFDDDDRWLYLPALKRVKRISSSNKSGSFMGSEFSYEDIASQEVEKYTYRWVRDELYEGADSFVVEYYPVDSKNSGYRRRMVWIDKKEYRTLKAEFYDRKDSLLKTLTMKGYRQYKGRFWRADEMFMVNHQTGKSTTLKFAGYEFGVGLEDKDFTQLSLKRAR